MWVPVKVSDLSKSASNYLLRGWGKPDQEGEGRDYEIPGIVPVSQANPPGAPRI